MNIANRSLRFKLTALMAGIVVCLGVCSAIATTMFVREQEEVVLRSVESQAVNVADAIQAQFFERYSDVQAFALNPDLQNSSKSVTTESINNLTMLYAIYDLVVITDASGHITAVNSKSPAGKDINTQALIGRNVSDTPWFKSTMAGNFTEDKAKGFVGTYVEDVQVDSLVSEVYGEKRPGTSFSTQLKDRSGKVIGVVSNRAGSNWFEQALKAGYDKLDEMGYNRGEVILVGNTGLVLAAAQVTETNGKPVMSRNFDFVLKHNMLEAKSPSVLAMRETKKAGHTWGYNNTEKYESASGYSPVIGPKFVDSIGWSIIARGPKADILAETVRLQWFVYGSLALVMILALVVATFYSNSLSNRLRSIAVEITENSSSVGNMAVQMAEASGELSSSTTEQAAALQETVSSIDEVSSMISKNADNAKRSQDTSVTSSDAAQKGKQVVDEMIESIEEINRSNTDIMKQIENSNQQIGEIVKVITEIGTKTKVINDIVFQTKLLSFNASVEAARAGEHGKGFAVVAEEVGNLAQMSGNAAKEISSMLEGSIHKVEQIVNSTRSSVDQLMKDSKAKVEAGTVTAKRCGEVLDEIVRNVGDVGSMVSEIAIASKEQSQGVNEINKAMNQLDQVTQSNAAAAQQASTIAEQLRTQGGSMSRVVSELILTVEGNGANRAATAAPASTSGKPHEAAAKGKVLAFEKAKPSATATGVTKMASGSAEVPSRNDSRFEEV